MQRKSEAWEFFVLGASGGRGYKRSTTCLHLPPDILIDAGAVFSLKEDQLLGINHIFLSHSHMDHLVDLPFLIDYTFSLRDTPLHVYGHPDTLSALRKGIMNWEVWPEFGSIKLVKTGDYAINYVELFPEQEIRVGEYTIKPFLSNHTVTTLGFVVKKHGKGFIFTSDTYKNPYIWAMANSDPSIKVVLVDVSFPSYMHALASASMHNTPSTLREDMELLKRKDVKVYAMHLKPFFEKEIEKELKQMGISIVLNRKRVIIR